MRIKLSPQRRDDSLAVIKQGDVLTINGEVFDFTSLPDGATIPSESIATDWIVGDVSRVDGELEFTMLIPHGPKPSPSVAFPEDIIDPADGELAIPFDVIPEPVELELSDE